MSSLLSTLSCSSPSSSSLSPSNVLSIRPLLFLVLLLLLFVSSTTAAPYYEGGEDDIRDDGSSPFETDGSSGGSSSRSSYSTSIPIPRISTTTRTETATDRSIRTETITPHPTVLSPHIVSALQPTSPHPTLLSIQPSTTTVASEPNPTINLDIENSRMIEIIANLTKKLETQQAAGTDVSISFTPDELKSMQEIIGATGLKLKENFETTRRQLMIPDGPVRISDLNNDVKQQRPDKTFFHEKEETVSSTPTSERNITVIDEATLPPTDPIPDDLVLTEESSDHDGQPELIDEVLEEAIRPALCKLNTEDEVVSIIWMLIQTRIREWGYDEDESTVLALTAFGLLLDSEHHAPIVAEEPGFWDDVKAGIQCFFRDCRLAMPSKTIRDRVLNEPSSPKMKRETVEYQSDLFECHCPKGYEFI